MANQRRDRNYFKPITVKLSHLERLNVFTLSGFVYQRKTLRNLQLSGCQRGLTNSHSSKLELD